MSMRWRKDGRLLCGAASDAEEGDVYFDDGQQYEMSRRGIIVADPEHERNGLWHWTAHLLPSWFNFPQSRRPV